MGMFGNLFSGMGFFGIDQIPGVGDAVQGVLHTDDAAENPGLAQGTGIDTTEDKAKALMQPLLMPSLTSSDTRLAKRRSLASLLSRGGRASTILSGDPLGGGK